MGDVFILRGCTWGGLKGVVNVFTVVGVSLSLFLWLIILNCLVSKQFSSIC